MKARGFGGVFVMAAAVLGCSAAHAQQLDYWVYSDFAQGDALALQQSFIDEFQAANPGVTISISGRDDDSLLAGEIAGAASGTGPDIFMNSTAQGANLVEAGAMKNIYTEWMAMPESFRSQFSKQMVDLCTPAPETMYCIPYTGFGTFMYRNLDVLEKAGIDPAAPIKDWADWKAQMEKIKASGAYAIPDMSLEWFGLAVAYSGVAGADQWGIDFTNKRTLMTPEKLTETFKFFVDVAPYTSGTPDIDTATNDLFMTNQLAFIPSGPWLDPTLQAAKANGLRYDRVLVPGNAEGKYAGLNGYEFIAISPNEHADLSWKFLTHVVDYPQMLRWASKLGRYNANDRVTSDPAVASNEVMTITTEAVKHGLLHRPPYFVKPYPSDYWSILIDGAASVIDGDATAEEGAAETIARLNTTIADE